VTLKTVKVARCADGSVSFAEIGPRQPFQEKKVEAIRLPGHLRGAGMSEPDVAALMKTFEASDSAMISFIPRGRLYYTI
jgi:hypothetical protein